MDKESKALENEADRNNVMEELKYFKKVMNALMAETNKCQNIHVNILQAMVKLSKEARNKYYSPITS